MADFEGKMKHWIAAVFLILSGSIYAQNLEWVRSLEGEGGFERGWDIALEQGRLGHFPCMSAGCNSNAITLWNIYGIQH